MNNPHMFEQAKKNMNRGQMTQAAEMMSKMSDAELLNYAKMSGMPITDVNMLRQSAAMMKNMDDSQFESYKNMAQNMNYPGFGGGSSTTPSPSTQQTTNQPTLEEYKPLENLKQKGNNFFNQGKYQEASTTYTECLLEIEEIRAKEHTSNKSELDKIEISVRMNLANSKAKLEDYDAVLTQAKTVLKMGENGKAYFRAGQALYHFKKYRASLDHLEKAKKLLNDDTVVELYNKVKTALGQEPVETSKNEESKADDGQSKSNEEEYQDAGDKKKPKMKKKNLEEGGASSYTPQFNPSSAPKDTYRDTKIEEEKYESKPQTTTSSPSYPNTTGFPRGPDNMDPETIKKGQEQLKNMNPDQLKTMTDQFKTMDNSFIRQMMKSQTGMDMSDEQIQQMKMFMTPDMLKNVSSMDPSQIQNNMKKNAPTTSSSSGSTTSGGSSNISGSQSGAQPNLNDMMAGGMPNISGDMVSNMIDMMSQNPEMLKSMVGMLGENNPIGNMIKNKSPEELKRLMVWIKRGSKVVFFFSPVYKVIKKYWQLLAGLLVGYVLYKMFGS